MLLRAADDETDLTERLAACFVDLRDPKRTEHSVLELVRQRLFGLALGYEDLNDHDDLRSDPLLAEVVGKREPTGSDRVRESDRGRPLAGKSTLNRLEWALGSEAETDRYHRIALDPEAMNTFFVDVFLDSYERGSGGDHPRLRRHGRSSPRPPGGPLLPRLLRPLLLPAALRLLRQAPAVARLRRSNIDASEGTVEELSRIVGQIRERWPRSRSSCGATRPLPAKRSLPGARTTVSDYVTGIARNPRSGAAARAHPGASGSRVRRDGQPTRVFDELRYRTLSSWSRSRRVVGKAEITERGPNPRFVVTSLPSTRSTARGSTKSSTAPAVTWRTASRSSNSICFPRGPRAD